MQKFKPKPLVVRVILNTQNSNRHQWAKIVEGKKILHTGQPRYIGAAAAEIQLGFDVLLLCVLP